MPADDIDLSVSMDQAENGIMLLATDTPWDDATNIEANKYYYYSDGQLHPFDTVMGQGGNDSYKYVRYKAGGKTYTVNAYCMQHSMQSPPSGTTYKNMVELDEGGDDKYLRKALFYGYGGPGWGHTFNGYNVKSIMEKYGCSSETRAMQHYLVDYLYDGESGFGGALSTTAKNMLKEIKAALAKMPDPTAMKLLPGLSVNATGKETESFTWKANEAFTITIHLENGVSLVNETTGKTASGNVTVKGGEKFHLVATTANMGSLKGKYAITSNFPLDFHAMLLKLESSQDIGFGYYTDSADLQITVDWPEEAVIEITKKDGDTGKNLAGAVYGVYSDNACTKLIVKMPPTDSNGSSRVTLTKTQDTVYLKEITAPEGYVVQASSYGVKLVVGSTTKQTVTDKEQKGNLTVYKEGEVFVGAVSDENGTSFQYEKRRQKGAVYNIYAAEDIVTAGGKTVYKKGAEVAKNLITGENGSVTVKNLPLGSYNVTEAQAPENFYNAKETKKVTISYAGQTAEAAFSETTFTNDRQKAVVQVIKKDKDTENTLSGGHFALFAAQDMKTVDGKVAVKKDALIETAITGTDGKAAFKADLPVGFSYYVKEVQAPAGYVRNENDTYSFQFSYTNDEQAKISFSHTFVNDRVSAAISLNKKDAETKENKAQGDASLENTVLVKADELLTKAVTGEDGKTVFEQDLPFGTYYIKELAAPDGFVSSDEQIEVTAKYQGQEVKTVKLETVFKNEPTTTEFTKSDITTGVELDGATLTVLDSDGKEVEKWTSVKGKAHVIKRLHVGKTYTLREEFAPYGYLQAEEVKFTVSDTADVQKVEMKDAVPVGRIIINKKGEFVKEVTWKDMLAGGMDAAFGYVTGSLKDVTFEIYAAEDIKAADGESSDYYKKDELVATITTDALGYARSEDLPLGKYYVKEKETADGYVLDGEIREVDLTYRDQNTPVVTYDEDWQNNRQKAKVTVVKKEKNTDRVLEGGVFALYTKNDILNAEGEVILKADTMIEQKATDQDGRIVFTADLPINGNYYVKEVQAPAGFVTTEEIKEFDFAYAGEEVAEVSFEFTYEDEPTTFEITKSDITTGEELPGAKLKVSDSEGNVVDEWTSGSTPHIIKELEVGKKYTLTETIPADGYATAESITFVVENTADIQKVEMQDDTTKILISKVDMTDGSSEVKGAKLYILNENQEVMESWTSGDQHHYVEKLPIGTYTLLEETAPKGYIVANKVTFEIKDTGDIQGTKMEDEQAMGKVILNKTDKDTKKPMKGVEFALCDSKGKVLETLVTDSAGHAESKNYPIATFKNGQYKKAITYILKETKTLDGYQLDETEHKIQFEYVNDRTPVIEYTLDLTNKKAPEKDTPETSENQGVSTPVSHGSDATSVSNSPKTGDNTNIAIFVLALAVSAGCLGTVVTVKRKRK